MLDGRNPYPPPDFDPTAAPNFIWPPLVAYLLSPLTLLPLGAADFVMVAARSRVLRARALARRAPGLAGLRARRAVAADRRRDARLAPDGAALPAARAGLALARPRPRPGVPVGFATALKFFVWPLGGVAGSEHGATRRRCSRQASPERRSSSSSRYVSIDHYVRSLLQLGRGFDQDSYTLFGLLVQSGASETTGRIAMWAAGAALLAATWRYRSFTLAIAAALTLSPIVWLDYFALAAVPLAIARPRLSWVWFLPLATWGLSGAGLGIGDPWDIARLLVVFAVVLARRVPGRARPAACDGAGRRRDPAPRPRRRDLAVRRAPVGRARHRARDVLGSRTGSRSTSTTSSTPRPSRRPRRRSVSRARRRPVRRDERDLADGGRAPGRSRYRALSRGRRLGRDRRSCSRRSSRRSGCSMSATGGSTASRSSGHP